MEQVVAGAVDRSHGDDRCRRWRGNRVSKKRARIGEKIGRHELTNFQLFERETSARTLRLPLAEIGPHVLLLCSGCRSRPSNGRCPALIAWPVCSDAEQKGRVKSAALLLLKKQ